MSLFLLSCSGDKKFDNKNYKMIFGTEKHLDVKRDKNFVDDKDLQKIDIEFVKSDKGYSGDVFSNIDINKDGIFFVNGGYVLYSYLPNLKFNKKVTMKLSDKWKVSNVFVSSDKYNIYVLFDFGKLIVFDKNTFEKQYELQLNNTFNTKPVSDGFYLFLKASDSSVYSLFPEDGKLLWTYKPEPISTSYKSVGPILLSEGYLISSNGLDSLVILNKSNGDAVYSASKNDESVNFKNDLTKQFNLFNFENDKILQKNVLNDNDTFDYFYTLAFNGLSIKKFDSFKSDGLFLNDNFSSVVSFKNGFLISDNICGVSFLNFKTKALNDLFYFKTKDGEVCNLKISSFYDGLKYYSFVYQDNLYLMKGVENGELYEIGVLVKNKKTKIKDVEYLESFNENVYIFSNGYIYKNEDIN